MDVSSSELDNSQQMDSTYWIQLELHLKFNAVEKVTGIYRYYYNNGLSGMDSILKRRLECENKNAYSGSILQRQYCC